MDLPEREERIAKLRRQIARCRRCDLFRSRTKTVAGEGSLDPAILFIGEAPGRNEDLQGKPFVGRAGAILDELLSSVGLQREDVYICNILKCRPPGNRNPARDEIRSCAGSLDVQLKTIDPAIIATLGNFATTTIFAKFGLPGGRISQMRGKVFEASVPEGHRKIVPLFHPAVATYDPSKLKLLKKDFEIFIPLLSERKMAQEAAS